MMYWYGENSANGWQIALMILGMTLFWAAIITAGILAARALGHQNGRAATTARPAQAPERILAERYARGEIDEHEYDTRLATLRGQHEPSPDGHTTTRGAA